MILLVYLSRILLPFPPPPLFPLFPLPSPTPSLVLPDVFTLVLCLKGVKWHGVPNDVDQLWLCVLVLPRPKEMDIGLPVVIKSVLWTYQVGMGKSGFHRGFANMYWLQLPRNTFFHNKNHSPLSSNLYELENEGFTYLSSQIYMSSLFVGHSYNTIVWQSWQSDANQCNKFILELSYV